MSVIQITLAAARVNAGFSQNQVANALKVNKSTVVSWENGRTIPNAKQAETLAEMYGLEMGHIKW